MILPLVFEFECAFEFVCEFEYVSFFLKFPKGSILVPHKQTKPGIRIQTIHVFM